MTPDPTPIELLRLDPGGYATWARAVVSVYADAFRPPPYSRSDAQVTAFGSTLRQHLRRTGFVGFAAVAEGHIVGFTYGYPSQRGQWWHDQVRRALGDDADEWLEGAFEYVELAVTPASQRQGIGRRLHDTLLSSQPLRTAVLSTLDAPTAGLRMYESAGWQIIHTGFRFERSATPYVIMGLRMQVVPA